MLLWHQVNRNITDWMLLFCFMELKKWWLPWCQWNMKLMQGWLFDILHLKGESVLCPRHTEEGHQDQTNLETRAGENRWSKAGVGGSCWCGFTRYFRNTAVLPNCTGLGIGVIHSCLHWWTCNCIVDFRGSFYLRDTTVQPHPIQSCVISCGNLLNSGWDATDEKPFLTALQTLPEAPSWDRNSWHTKQRIAFLAMEEQVIACSVVTQILKIFKPKICCSESLCTVNTFSPVPLPTLHAADFFTIVANQADWVQSRVIFSGTLRSFHLKFELQIMITKICQTLPDTIMKNSQSNSHMTGTSEMFTFVTSPPSQVCLFPHFPQIPLKTRTWSVALLFTPSVCEYMYWYVRTNNSRVMIFRTIFKINETQIK